MLGWFKKRRTAKKENEIQDGADHLNEQVQDTSIFPQESSSQRQDEDTNTIQEPRIATAESNVKSAANPTTKPTANIAEEQRTNSQHGSASEAITSETIIDDGAQEGKSAPAPKLFHPRPPQQSEPAETADFRAPSAPQPQELAEKDNTETEKLSVIPEDAVIAETIPEKAETGEEKHSRSLFQRLASRLSKTRESIVSQMDTLFLGKKVIDAELLDNLEELLITSDIGINTALELLDYARMKVKRKELDDPEALKKFIKEKLRTYIANASKPAELVMPKSGPFVIMVVGVNGVGKTTTIGKIAHKFVQSGQSVLLVAADTFRAAAVSQLKIWGERNGVEVVSKHEGADPSSVAFDAMSRAVEGNFDVVLVDTAGRLHTQTNLMEELKKIKRVMAKKLPGAPHEVLLVLDATTGQNGISQAKLFDAAVDITGLALTKLDGTAKGGIVVNISRDMNIPIRFIGIGETIDDLRDFDADEFIAALFGDESYTH